MERIWPNLIKVVPSSSRANRKCTGLAFASAREVVAAVASSLFLKNLPDLVILGVKAYDIDEVLTQLAPVLTHRTVILTLQNGIDTEDRIIAKLERDCVVGGVAFIYSKIAEPGVIDHYKKGVIAIGEFMGHESERLLAIHGSSVRPGFPVSFRRTSGARNGRRCAGTVCLIP